MKIKSAIFILMIGMMLNPFSLVNGEDFTQPIEFSHKTHAGTNEIPCEYCHSYARRSINSGAPPVESCIGCHQVIKGTETDQQDKITQVIEYWDAKKTIPWKKIHDNPDFVHFSHKRHVNVGMDCTDCHGDINKLDLITFDTMIADLSMGWCMTCHQKVQPTVNGKIIAPVRNTRGGTIINAKANKIADGQITASTDCTVCHK